MFDTEKQSQSLQLKSENQPKINGEIENDINHKNKQEIKEEVITIKKEAKYGEIPYRWFFLICYCLSAFANQIQWVAYSSIATAFSDNYDKPLWKVNMFSLIFMIVYPISCIPSGGWLINSVLEYL